MELSKKDVVQVSRPLLASLVRMIFKKKILVNSAQSALNNIECQKKSKTSPTPATVAALSLLHFV